MLAVLTELCLIALLFCRCSAYSSVKDRFYPRYHLAPPYGWMTEPNGFCEFNKEYHLFYQYNPATSQEPGIAHWGHAKSQDFFRWTHLDIAMHPDQIYDRDGVFSGSTLIQNNYMYIFYTGNINYTGRIPYHRQRQALGVSNDAVTFYKYPRNPIIMGEEHQPNIRAPKVWKHQDTYYMVLGNSFNNDTLGRALLYSSRDMVDWSQLSVLGESDGTLGYMWECPDFFALGGKWVLLFSPQGMEPQGDKFKNLYQTGYFIGDFDYENNLFIPITDFEELDNGHDFYASQTMLDTSGRRIVVALFDTLETVYPERNDGWTGQMTIPRTLSLTKDFKITQLPVKEIKHVRGKLLYSGKPTVGDSVELKDNTAEILIKASRSKDFEFIIDGGNNSVIIKYCFLKAKVTLDRGGNDGIRRTTWRPSNKLEMRIFIDRSSVELFCGDGEVTFSSRFFPNDEVIVMLGIDSVADSMSVYSMKRTVHLP